MFAAPLAAEVAAAAFVAVAFAAVVGTTVAVTFALVGTTAFGFVETLTVVGAALVVAGAAVVVATTGGRAVVSVGFSPCSDDTHAVTPAISTTTTMLIPINGASVRT